MGPPPAWSSGARAPFVDAECSTPVVVWFDSALEPDLVKINSPL